MPAENLSTENDVVVSEVVKCPECDNWADLVWFRAYGTCSVCYNAKDPEDRDGN